MELKTQRKRVLHCIVLLSGFVIAGTAVFFQVAKTSGDVIWCSLRQKVSPDVYVLRQVPDGGDSIKSERSFVISRSDDGALIYVSRLIDIVVDDDPEYAGLIDRYFEETGDVTFDERAYFGRVSPR